MNETIAETGVARIFDDGVYTLVTARQVLGLKKSTLSREIREHRLRVSRRAGKVLILGTWLREWIEQGEAVREKESAE